MPIAHPPAKTIGMIAATRCFGNDSGRGEIRTLVIKSHLCFDHVYSKAKYIHDDRSNEESSVAFSDPKCYVPWLGIQWSRSRNFVIYVLEFEENGDRNSYETAFRMFIANRLLNAEPMPRTSELSQSVLMATTSAVWCSKDNEN